MHLPETSIQLTVNVGSSDAWINDIVAGLPELGRSLSRQAAAEILQRAQAAHLVQVFRGEAEIVCQRCGVVHGGGLSLLRRGTRARLLRTSSGDVRFRLLQVTCRDCGRTWSPYAELLGLAPRQRIAEELERKLVEAVTNLSYQKASRLGAAWLGSGLSPRSLHRCVQARGKSLRFTPAAECKVALADGTKVPAGRRLFGTDVRIAFQVLGRSVEHGRSVVQKRIVGWSIGAVGWSQALPPGIASEVIVTDRESGIAEVIEAQHPGVRHQLCEWHLGHTMNHLMALDHVPVRERRGLVAQLNAIIWDPRRGGRERLRAFCKRLVQSPRSKAMLLDSISRIMFPRRSAQRTTSPAEREMREINRRTDVGAQWSVSGINNMLKLRHGMRLNPDDYERIWTPVRAVQFSEVPRA
jgi:hypothetical protein